MPILGAVVTLFGGNGFLFVFDDVSIHKYGQIIFIIIVSGMGDDMPILGAVVTLFGGNGLLLFLVMVI